MGAATYSHKQRETNIYQSRIVDAEEILLLHSPQGTVSARLAITKDLETLNLVPQIAKKKSTALDE